MLSFEFLVNKATIFSPRGPASAGDSPPWMEGRGRSRSGRAGGGGERGAHPPRHRQLRKSREIFCRKRRCQKIKRTTVYFERGANEWRKTQFFRATQEGQLLKAKRRHLKSSSVPKIDPTEEEMLLFSSLNINTHSMKEQKHF